MNSCMMVEDIHKIAVIGGGYVGHGVAQYFAQAGYFVSLYNRTAESSDWAMTRLGKGLALFVDAGLMTRQEADAARERVHPLTDLGATVRDADYIVEAVPDDLSLKRKVFREIEVLAPARAILATETSGLRISDIVSGMERPERCLTTHNYTPPPLIPVVEVVPGEKTDPGVVETTCALLRRIGKEPVIIKEIPGHIGSRFTNALRREAYHLIEQGLASPEAIDTVLRSVGRLFPVMGILLVTDFSGLDMALNSQRNIVPHLCHRSEPSPLVEKMVQEGRLGIKTGRGFYRWTPERIEEIEKARGRELIRWMQQSPLPPLPPTADVPETPDSESK